MTELFRNTLSFWHWGLLALVPPAIIALYFLKLRRQPLEVPSTYLWKRSIEDLHVNSLWQRLRQNLLMFLQLLLVGLAILALLRPGWEGSRLEGQRFIFLIDNSASMSATDTTDAPNRLDDAKQLAEGLVDQMDSGMSAMIISFADKPQVVQEFTSNRRLLRDRLASIQPTARGTDLSEALALASGLANPGKAASESVDEETASAESPPATAYIFSDGRFEDVTGDPLDNLQPVYVPVGSFEAQNLAVSAVSTRRNEERPEQRQAFVQVANFTGAPQKVVVELELDGQFLDAAEVEIPAGETKGTVFPLAAGAVGGFSARLKYTLDGVAHDSLRQDDVGYAAINDTGTGRVLVVSPGNVPLDVALGTARAKRLANVEVVPPATLESPEYRREAENGAYDLIVYDQCAPQQLPRANTLFVGTLPPGSAWRRSEDASGDPNSNMQSADAPVAGPQIIDWDRASPLLASVDLGDVVIADSLVVRPPAGGTVLIESTAGPIAAIAPRDSYQDVVLGFEIVGQDADGTRTANTNWPIRPSFPTFWLNVLEYLASRSEEQEMTAVRPGRPVELHAPAGADRLTVTAPDGRETTVLRSEQDAFTFTGTEKPGVYQVRQGEAPVDLIVERFAVNLFDRAESDIGVRPTQDPESQTVRAADIRIGQVDVAASTDRTPARQETWKVLLACALFVLVLEWYIYNRRVYL
ncbi:MAG: VWA domain-containing protein [Pirellulales bacterium]